MPDDRRPNVLWLMSDQHNARAMGHEGRNVRTPTLDWLAEDGVRFSHAYCNNPICGPSRLSYITGQYPHTHRHVGNDLHEFPQRNPNTISAVARRHGYQTALIGKSHMIGEWDREGFEHIRYCDLTDADRADPLTNHYFRYLVEQGVAEEYEQGRLPEGHPGRGTLKFESAMSYEHSLEAWTGRETRTFLRECDTRRPFFAQMSFQRPHAPLSPPPELADMYDPADVDIPDSAVDLFERQFATKPERQQTHVSSRGGYPFVPEDEGELRRHIAYYYTLITMMDQEMGETIDLLREQGELDNTVIVYVADHGDFAGDHGLMQKNMGIYESIHRVPFLVRYPGCPEGQSREGLIESVDLFPTLADLMDVPTADTVDGASLLPIIEEGAPGREEVVCEWSRPSEPTMWHAIRTEDFRLVYYGRGREGELYDHRDDPMELVNRWSDPDYADVRLALTERVLDHVMHYEKRSDVARDRVQRQKTRNTMTTMLHKRAIGWDRLEALYED